MLNPATLPQFLMSGSLLCAGLSGSPLFGEARELRDTALDSLSNGEANSPRIFKRYPGFLYESCTNFYLSRQINTQANITLEQPQDFIRVGRAENRCGITKSIIEDLDQLPYCKEFSLFGTGGSSEIKFDQGAYSTVYGLLLYTLRDTSEDANKTIDCVHSLKAISVVKVRESYLRIASAMAAVLGIVGSTGIYLTAKTWPPNYGFTQLRVNDQLYGLTTSLPLASMALSAIETTIGAAIIDGMYNSYDFGNLEDDAKNNNPYNDRLDPATYGSRAVVGSAILTLASLVASKMKTSGFHRDQLSNLGSYHCQLISQILAYPVQRVGAAALGTLILRGNENLNQDLMHAAQSQWLGSGPTLGAALTLTAIPLAFLD